MHLLDRAVVNLWLSRDSQLAPSSSELQYFYKSVQHQKSKYSCHYMLWLLDEANTVFDYTAFLGIKTQEMLNLGGFPHKDFPQNRVTIAFTYLLFLFMKKRNIFLY